MTALSPTLQRYRELVVDLAPEERRNSTWIDLARWAEENISQDILFELCVELWKELDPISQAEEPTPDGLKATAIRDACDVLWYALSDETQKRANDYIATLDHTGD